MFKLLERISKDQIKDQIKDQNKELSTKTINEVIEEIHETFYTEVDRLLELAKIETPLDTNQNLIYKAERLKTLGFTNTREVKEAENEVERLKKLRIDNEAKKTLIEAINYFSFKYPNYKFITEESVKKICKKYNLVYGEINQYIGTVPDENLKHIEDFKVHEYDECFFYEEFYYSSKSQDPISKSKGYKTVEHFKDIEDQFVDPDSNYNRKRNGARGDDSSPYYLYMVTNIKCPLEIVAPLKDFNTRPEVLEFQISVPDPIVLKPIIFNNQKHYLIVTAWGLEASDELIVNTNQRGIKI